jgi:Fe-S-cluster containining protein
MQKIHLKKFKQKFDANKRSLRSFITSTENNPPKQFNTIMEKIDKEVWEEVNCLQCANCCKLMSPTYTPQDIKRIAAHLGMTPKDFKEKWLCKDKKGEDWVNLSQPCQFLDLKTNMCTIYEVRPADCAGFPHFLKKPQKNYFYINKQNIEYCPASMLMVEKMKKALKP